MLGKLQGLFHYKQIDGFISGGLSPQTIRFPENGRKVGL